MDAESVTTWPILSVTDSVDFDFGDLAHLSQPFREFSTSDKRREEAKFFIDTFAECYHDYPDKWLGITWVALQAMDSMCVVVREDDLLNLKRKLSPDDINDPSYFYRLFWNAIISNVEDIEDFKLRGNLMIPFSVVTVCPSMGCNISGSQASMAEYSAMYRATKTSKFLQDKMKSGATSTIEKTVQTAISALEHLFLQKFEADEIRVFVWKKDEIVGWELPRGRKIPDLKELLATVRAQR